VATLFSQGPSTGSVGAPSREPIGVAVRVLPSSAQIAIDGVVVPGNPFFAHYPRDGRAHHVLAFADGFEPKSKDVPFAGDVALDLTLDPHGMGSVTSAQSARAAAPWPGHAPKPGALEIQRVFPDDPPARR
jgi:hypothetical protein